MSDKRVVVFNHPGSRSIVPGAHGYLIQVTGSDRCHVLVRSRGGRYIHAWIQKKRMADPRAKNLPEEHPLYNDPGVPDYGDLADEIARNLKEWA